MVDTKADIGPSVRQIVRTVDARVAVAQLGPMDAVVATPNNVLREVIRHGMIPVTIGVVAGVVVSLGLARVVAGFLYRVAPTDPASLGVAAAVLLVTGMLAAVVPAWRAGRTSPVEVLRVD